jgi:predicted ATPase
VYWASPPAPDRAFAVFHGLYWLCANLAQARPLALVVDDLDWADAASLRFLSYLAPRVGELPFAVVVAARPVNDDERAPLVEAITAGDSVVAVHPPPLSVAAVGVLVEELSGEPPADGFTEGLSCCDRR